MKLIKQMAIIFGICFVGQLLSSVLPFAFPGSVIGLILIAFLLMTNMIKEEQIKEVSDFFLGSMALFFVPAGIGIFEELGSLKGQLFLILGIVILSLIITFVGTCFTVLFVTKLLRRLKHHE
ncbi:MAG: CidA/LrgA family protein [Lachnospiraceae bacterium]